MSNAQTAGATDGNLSEKARRILAAHDREVAFHTKRKQPLHG